MEYKKLTYEMLEEFLNELELTRQHKPFVYLWSDGTRLISSAERHSPEVYREIERQLKAKLI